jgi:hypothetical protein
VKGKDRCGKKVQLYLSKKKKKKKVQLYPEILVCKLAITN